MVSLKATIKKLLKKSVEKEARPAGDFQKVRYQQLLQQRKLYQETESFDPYAIRSIAYEVLRDYRVHYYDLEKTDDAIYLTLFKAVRLVRERATGEVRIEYNQNLLDYQANTRKLAVTSAALEEMFQPVWGPNGGSRYGGMRDIISADMVVLDKQAFRPYLDLQEVVLDMLLERICQLIMGSETATHLTSLFHGDDDVVKRFWQERRILQNTAWGKNRSQVGMAKAAYRQLWHEVLAPEVRHYIGYYQVEFRATLKLYNDLAKHLADVERMMRETPQFARLAYFQLPTEQRFVKDAVGLLKQKLKGEGFDLSEAGWRWLTRQTTGVTMPLLYTGQFTGRFIKLANLAGELNLTLPATFVKAMLDRYGKAIWHKMEYGDHVTSIEAAKRYIQTVEQAQHVSRYVIKALAQEAALRRKKRTLKVFLENEFAFVCDWLMGVHVTDYCRFPAKQISFAWLNRKQTEWHEERQKQRNTHYSEWQCLLKAPFEVSPQLQIVPLINSVEMDMEGERMHHCVGSYTRSCRQGHSRIFSLRTPQGKRLATLELRREEKNGKSAWKEAQLRGPCNHKVSTDIQQAAKALIKEYNMLWKKLDPDAQNALLDAPESVKRQGQPVDYDELEDIPF